MSDLQTIAPSPAAAALATLRAPPPKPTIKLGGNMAATMWSHLRERLDGLKKLSAKLVLFAGPEVRAEIARQARDLLYSYGALARQLGKEALGGEGDPAVTRDGFLGVMKQLRLEMAQAKTIYEGNKTALAKKKRDQYDREVEDSFKTYHATNQETLDALRQRITQVPASASASTPTSEPAQIRSAVA